MAQDKTRHSDFERGRQSAFKELLEFFDKNPNWTPNRTEWVATVKLLSRPHR